MNTLTKNKKFLVSLAIIIACFVLAINFPADSPVQSISRNIFFLMIVPMLYIKFILRENISNYGWNLKNKRLGFPGMLAMLLAALSVSIILINHTDFTSQHALSDYVKANFWIFLVYELLFVNFFILAYESFFRGFILFLFSSRFFFWAIFIQAMLFALVLVIFKTPLWQMVNDVSIAILGGILAYRTKSFFYSYAAALIHSIILDGYIIHMLK